MALISKAQRPSKPASHSHWLLQDAKARLSELVRRVHSEGPQHVSVHGRDAVVVISVHEYEALRGERTGQALVDALQACPRTEADFTPQRGPMPVREVQL
jgi:prevent-host-death family protein